MTTPRITLRCYTEDLGLPLPGIEEELDAEHPIVEELKNRAEAAPRGLKHLKWHEVARYGLAPRKAS
jgi:hypothetical protein